VTALTKLFRTTTFRLSLTYLALFSAAAAAVAIFYIYWNTTVLLTRQLHDTIDAELKGLAEQYTAGGLTRLVRTVADRSQTPGNSLYFVADPEGRRVAGNLASITQQLSNSLGPVEFEYSRPAEGGIETRLAFANVFRLPGGYRLIVGRDIEDRRELARVIRSALLWGLGVMVLFGIGGGYLVSRNLLARIDAVAATSRTIMRGISRALAGGLATSRSPVGKPQPHAGEDRQLMKLARGLRQYRARSQDAAQPFAQPRRSGAAQAYGGPASRGA
jgi:hypothetical protein